MKKIKKFANKVKLKLFTMRQAGSNSLVNHSTPEKSNFLIPFLKTLKDCIVCYESGIELHTYSFGTVNRHNLRPYVDEVHHWPV